MVDHNQTQVAGHFTFWISVSLRLSLNPKFRLSKIRIFVELLAHPLETPWPKWMALCQNVRRSVPYICDRSPPHLATLRKTETADG